MTRRIVRTIVHISATALFTFIFIFFLDRNFRVLPNAIHGYLPTHHAGSVITDITIAKCSSINVFSSCTLDQTCGRLNPQLAGDKKKKHGAGEKEEEPWEARPGGLWIKRSNRRGVSDSEHAVTAVDVLFGDDAVEARPGWEVTGMPLLLDGGTKIPSAQLTVRRGAPKEIPKPVPKIGDNGRFKIVQLADLHLSTGVGNCRDAVPEDWNGGKCEADPRTLDFVNKVLEEERPNLVVLSGDQVNGDTAPDVQTAIFKYAQLLIKRKIPYVSIFGNHDDEGTMSRAAQMELIEALPYSLSKAGPPEIDGVGNYYIEVLARGSSGHSAITVYLLDSHAYSPNERKYPGYDWIKKNQIDWFRATAQGLKKQHRDYTHHHMDVAFIHIPIPEYVDVNATRVGNWGEPSTIPQYNSGFYEAMTAEGVAMVSCGHDHVNEYCALPQQPEGEKSKIGPWMCYAGGTGFGGYAGYGGFVRRIRVFDFDMNEARITTWKRVEHGEDVGKRVDELILVDGGRPVRPPPPEEEEQQSEA
ncbi:Phosphatase dcr2 [Collariella sp. IMI 366227]|nr:Phosphatase dcr2 [Collariella sp. IMI 366227]